MNLKTRYRLDPARSYNFENQDRECNATRSQVFKCGLGEWFALGTFLAGNQKAVREVVGLQTQSLS